MKRLALLISPLALLAAAPALACSYAQMPEEVGHTSAEFFGRKMAAAATYVDLVLVEDDGIRSMDERPTGVLTLRSIARLKGNGPDRFSLFGTGVTLQPDAERAFKAPLQHFTREDGRVEPFPYNMEGHGQLFPQVGAPLPVVGSSCSPPVLSGKSGRFYVVMRGADGRLLGDFPLYEGSRAHAFAFVPVSLDRDDYWLRAVMLGSSSPVPVEGPAVLHLRANADPARIEAALRRAGVIPVAAFVGSGGWLDEIRPADFETRSSWLARAVPLIGERNRGGFGTADHAAAEFLRSKLGVEQTYGGLGYEVAQALLASLRRKQAAKGAPAQLIAVAVSGPAEAIFSLAREPFADGLRPFPYREGWLASLPGRTEEERFDAGQAIERDIWILNGGNGNRAGTLPGKTR